MTVERFASPSDAHAHKLLCNFQPSRCMRYLLVNVSLCVKVKNPAEEIWKWYPLSFLPVIVVLVIKQEKIVSFDENAIE